MLTLLLKCWSGYINIRHNIYSCFLKQRRLPVINESHFILMKESIYQEDMTSLKVYTLQKKKKMFMNSMMTSFEMYEAKMIKLQGE